MTLLILSFLAGVLTILAPCILPLLPVIVGGSMVRDPDEKPDMTRPIIIAGSLALSVIVFTLLLKASTSLLGVSDMVWQSISGVIIVLLGIYFIRPDIWEKLPFTPKLNIASGKLLGKSYSHRGFGSAILIGFSLGPVFNSCSPTYALVVAGILPESFAKGFLYLIAYAVGLAGMLLLVAFAGQGLVSKLGWATDPHGKFRKIIGVLFVIVGLGVLFGFDKNIQTFVLESGWYDPIARLEESLR